MDNFDKFYNKALFFLSFRPRSEKEIRDYLSSKGRSASGRKKEVPQEIINLVIDKLKEHKFLDDLEFAKWWIERRSKKGIRLIKLELKQKGIDKDLVEKVINDSATEIVNDFDKALSLAQKRVKRYKDMEDKRKVYEKLGRFLASKGFDYDIIKEVIDQILPKEYNK